MDGNLKIYKREILILIWKDYMETIETCKELHLEVLKRVYYSD